MASQASKRALLSEGDIAEIANKATNRNPPVEGNENNQRTHKAELLKKITTKTGTQDPYAMIPLHRRSNHYDMRTVVFLSWLVDTIGNDLKQASAVIEEAVKLRTNDTSAPCTSNDLLYAVWRVRVTPANEANGTLSAATSIVTGSKRKRMTLLLAEPETSGIDNSTVITAQRTSPTGFRSASPAIANREPTSSSSNAAANANLTIPNIHNNIANTFDKDTSAHRLQGLKTTIASIKEAIAEANETEKDAAVCKAGATALLRTAEEMEASLHAKLTYCEQMKELISKFDL